MGIRFGDGDAEGSAAGLAVGAVVPAGSAAASASSSSDATSGSAVASGRGTGPGPGSNDDKSGEIREAATGAHEELARLEAALGKEPWLAGGRLSAADLGVFPSIQLLLRAAGKPIAEPLNLGFAPLGERYPNLAAWTGRIEALPGYDATYPPHWREG